MADPVQELFYASDATNRSVRVISAAGSQVRSIPVTGVPDLVQVSPDGSTILVSIPASKQLDVISTQSWQRVRTITVAQAPIQLIPVANSSFYSVHATESSQGTKYSIVRYSYSSGALTHTLVANNDRKMIACTDATGATLYVRGHVPSGQNDRIAVFDATAASPISLREYSLSDATAFAESQALAIDSGAKQLYTSDSTSLSIHTVNLVDHTSADWSLLPFRDEPYGYLPGAYSILSAPGSKFLYVGFGSWGWGQIRKLNGKAEATLGGTERLVRTPKGVFFGFHAYESSEGPATFASLVGADKLSIADEFPTINGTVELDSNGNGYGDRKDSGSVDAYVFADLNGDGVLSDNEPNTFIRTESGDATAWRMYLPDAGTYSLLIGHAGYVAKHVVETSARQTRFTVTAHQSLQGPRITIANAANVYGMVYYDTNADNHRGFGENAVATKVFLDLNENGQLDVGEPVQGNAYGATEPHEASDHFNFYLVPKRRYIVRAQSVDGAPFVGGVDHIEVSLLTERTLETGFAIDKRQVLKGVVVDDLDHDGITDRREQPLADVTVWFDRDRDRKVDANEPSGVTDAQGRYRIEIADDVYGMKPSFRAGSLRSFSVDNKPYYGSDTLETTTNFALYRLTTVQVTAFDDRDRNGRQNKGDRNLVGSTVFIDLDYDGTLDASEPRQMIDAAGHATFTNVATGTAKLQAIAPNGDTKTYAKAIVVTPLATEVTLTGEQREAQSNAEPPYGPLSSGFAPANFRIADLVADHTRNRVYVADFSGSTIRVIDTDAGKQIASVSISGTPIELAVTPDGASLLIVLDGNRVQVVSLVSLTSTRVMNIGHFVSKIGVGAGGVFYGVVSDDFDGSLGQFDLATGALRGTIRTDVRHGTEFWTNPEGTHLLIASDWSSDESQRVYEYGISNPNDVQLTNVHANTSNLMLDTKYNRLYGYNSSVEYSLAVAAADSDARTAWRSNQIKPDVWYGSMYFGVAMNLTGDYVYSVGSGPDLSVFSRSSGRIVHRYPMKTGGMEDMMVVTPNGHIVYAGRTYDGYLDPDDATDDGYDYSLGIVGSPTLSLPGNPALVVGTVFNDLNLNGKRDGKDKGYLDVVVYLDVDGDGVLGGSDIRTSVEYNNQFALEIPDALRGTYFLRLSQAGDYEDHTTLLRTRYSRASVTIQPGEQISGFKLGAVYGAVIEPSIFFDEHDIGAENWDEETLYPDLYLDLNNNAVRDSDEPFASSGSTEYSFTVKPGSYHLRFTDPEYVPSAGDVVINAVADKRIYTPVGVNPLRTMQGRLYRDLNADGVRNADEPAFPGVTVWIDGDNNGKRDLGEAFAVSNSSGRYFLQGERDGWSRVIRFRNEADQFASTSQRKRVLFNSPSVSIHTDFGLYVPGTLSVQTFADNDGNRKWSKGDRGLAGVSVFLDLDRDGNQDANETALVTDELGLVTFAALRPGAYVLQVRVPSAWRGTTSSTLKITSLQEGSSLKLQAGMRPV